MAPPKRKRPDRTHSQDDDRNARPSPHRPQNLGLGQAHQQASNNSPRGGGAGGGRRQSRGRGGSSIPSPITPQPSSKAMSPPSTSTFQPRLPPHATPSTPAPPTEQAAAPALQEVSESNEYLTPDRVAQWNAEARAAIIESAMVALREGELLTLAVIFNEIIECAIHGLLDSGFLGAMVQDIVAAPADELVDATSTFLDTLSSHTQDMGNQSLVRSLLIATQIDPARMRAELENDLLTSTGLVRDSFGRMAVRKATHALYRQSNYNLLREETEGYSKLMTEYFTTVNNQPPTQEVVNETYLRVNALIGAFDLDIGRVLDVTLDVFANLLVKHGRFFVKFLRSSAWWPELRGLEGLEWEEPAVSTLPQWAHPDSPFWHYSDDERDEQIQLRENRDRTFWRRVGELGEKSGIHAFFELGSRKITSNNRQADQTLSTGDTKLSKQQAARKWADAWMETNETLPPSGNDIAAQLLGFKLRFYASDARDSSDFLPENLIYLAALLIKIGFISILDLYPHLYPLEEDMDTHKEKILRAKKEKEAKENGSPANALTMAGALPVSDDPNQSTVARLREAESRSKPESERATPVKTDEASEKKKSLPEPADQKYQLLKSLLCIGALPEALFILGRHPWMLDAYPDLLKLIFRLAHHSISKVYDTVRPACYDIGPTFTKGSGLRGPSKPSDYVPRKSLRWAKPDEKDAGEGIDYKFYWEDWMDNIPVCQDVDDVIKLCNTFLGLVGPECGQDVVLLTKIVRIGKKSLADDNSAENRKVWIDFSTTFIAPALSFTGQNPAIINEVWDLFKNFDTGIRYTIYQQWFSSSKPAMRAAFARVQLQAKHTLSRISATNTKEYGRKIAKISFSSPGIVFQMTLKQLVAYPNMINALVECSRYLTLLGYDCLTWTLVTFFLKPIRGGTQEDGMLSAPWLKNIASFVGKAYQKYHLMDPTPILQFTTHQLWQPEGELYMLDVLEQMIKSMGGISLSGSVSEAMTLALCGGPVLRTFTLQHHLADNRHQAGASARRLIKCLKDTGLASQILLALAEHGEAYQFREDQRDAPDKVVLFNVDKLRSNLNQYLELLRAYIPSEEFDRLFPPLIEMMSEYDIAPSVAFTIARASIAAKSNAFRVEQQAKVLETMTETNGDVSMGGMESTAQVNGSTQSISKESSIVTEDVEMKDAPVAEEAPDQTTAADAPFALLNPEIEIIVDQLRQSMPDTYNTHPALFFYVTFWQLSLQDVDEDGIKQQYRDTIAHFQRQIPPPPERRGYPGPPRRETEDARRAKLEIVRFKEEEEKVIKENAIIRNSLRSEMQRWFDGVPMGGARSDALHTALLQDCFIPRSRLSLQDAQFAASMLKFMHKAGVPGFRTIKLLDLLFHSNKLTAIISTYTEDESRAFGRFLSEILRELQLWHENKNDAYVKFAHGSDTKVPGFGKRFDADRNATDFLKYDEFCLLLHKWHKAIFTALKTCIDSGNWMQMRNSINVLKALYPSFPKVENMAHDLRQIITQLGEAEERLDLKRSLQSILADFTKGAKFLVKEWTFKNLPAPPITTNGAEKAATEKANTPQPQETKLDATAAAFKPKAEMNGAAQESESKDAPVSKHGSSTPSLQVHSQEDPLTSKPVPKMPESRTSNLPQREGGAVRPTNKPGPPMHPSSVPSRPDNRNLPSQPTPASRASHVLPTRPDSQPSRRQNERSGMDRPPEHATHSRYDNRGPSGEYGRLERPGDAGRQREASPGRRGRPVPSGRTPERMSAGSAAEHREWTPRDPRDYDERNMRSVPRDTRGPPARPPPAWEPQDPRDIRDRRDPRDQRDRPDSRSHSGQSSMDTRRMPQNTSMAQEQAAYRREPLPPNGRLGGDREEHGPPRPPLASSQGPEGPPVNTGRAALISQEELLRQELPRSDREVRRDRGSRNSSPRRAEERRGDERWIEERAPQGYHGHGDLTREHRDERISHYEGPPPSNRDRRDEPLASTPTGPRGGRNESQSSGRASREMFEPIQGSRSSNQQARADPNYGRLTQPSDSGPPSGPRHEWLSSQPLTSGQRHIEQPHTQSQPPTPTAPSGPAASQSGGIHPSRLDNIQIRAAGGPPVQTNVPHPPSGPRGSGPGRTSQVPVPSSPVNRGPPTGPAMNERSSRSTGNPLRAINSVLTQSSPSDRPNERGPTGQNPTIRGRGATRANVPMEGSGEMNSPMPPPSHTSTPNSRGEGHMRNNRMETSHSRVEGFAQDEGRPESRGHRRTERSFERSERRPEERSSRNNANERPNQNEQERAPDRERNREKRGGERESSRRERGDGDRSTRDAERSQREGRDSSSRRERGSRDDGRASGREERDRRSRGGGAGDDGRKRGRDPTDQGQGHGDTKRRR
ncbi:hypothetical protein IQ07DRAFT_538013 [Pyrenochaeta sp. DS3sAY3a]|nr:hypothetical protein IQ07DRAFT_538013 [Pyrenochaeta sp. DS3sAY3a]